MKDELDFDELGETHSAASSSASYSGITSSPSTSRKVVGASIPAVRARLTQKLISKQQSQETLSTEDSSRKVRFAFHQHLSQQTTQSSLSQSSDSPSRHSMTSGSASRRSHTSSTSKQRGRRKALWLDDPSPNSDVADSPSLAAAAVRQTKRVRVESVNADTHTMLQDEISFLCSTILTSKDGENRAKAAAELAKLVSTLEAIDEESPIWSVIAEVPMTQDAGFQDATLQQAIHFILHFISLQCTAAVHGKDSKRGRKLRMIILQQPRLLRAMVQLVRLSSYELGSFGSATSAESSPVTMTSTPDSKASSSSFDPTAAGRRRHRTLPTIAEQDHENLSFTSPERSYEDLLDVVASRILPLLTTEKPAHSCGAGNVDDCWWYPLPLLALNRILTGKMEGSDVSCLDTDHLDFEPSDDDDEDSNPILVTNRLLREADVIAPLSLTLTDTLAALTKVRHCDGCLVRLFQRVHSLVSIVDSACLLDEINRAEFCREFESGGCVIESLMSTLHYLQMKGSEDVWGDVLLEVLRTLVSVTHENPVAASQLEQNTHLDVLKRVLHWAIFSHGNVNAGKLQYDATIFCLNILTNYVESGGSRSLLVELKVDKASFLQWLVRWLVEQTQSFQEAVVGSSFGASPSKHAERRLAAEEDEKLHTSGNGFVLLACLMIDCTDDALADVIHHLILSELPGHDRDGKIAFIKNTLRAFCNFYHFSIGGLSVAVVAPVKGLIQKLEAMQKPRIQSEVTSCT